MSDGDIPFRAEYAKSGRSRCVGRLCCNPIRKGTLRMAEMVQVRYVTNLAVSLTIPLEAVITPPHTKELIAKLTLKP